MTLYKTTKYGFKIEEIEATRETSDSFWIIDSRGSERRNAKRTNYENVFSTYEEAKQFLIDTVLDKIKRAEETLQKLKNDLSKYQKL